MEIKVTQQPTAKKAVRDMVPGDIGVFRDGSLRICSRDGGRNIITNLYSREGIFSKHQEAYMNLEVTILPPGTKIEITV